MTNEQLAVLLSGMRTQLYDAIKAVKENMPENAGRELEWWLIEENERAVLGPRKYEDEEKDFEQRPTGEFVALLFLKGLLGQIDCHIAVLRDGERKYE